MTSNGKGGKDVRATVSLLFFAMFSLCHPVAAHANTFPNRPPIEEHVHGKAVVIVEVQKEKLQNVIQEVEAKIPDTNIRKVYKQLFSGFSLQIEGKDINKLKKISGIKRIDPVTTYVATIDESIPFIGGEKIRHQLDEKGQRLTGKGIKVAVIDTGIDYHHPDLKKQYKGGYDVVDGDDDPMETLAQQGTPTIHGTHVAGIIAANGKMKGVAPEAELYVYRALGPGGQGTTEQVIEAIEKAVEDGADIINLSLGNSVNGPDWPTSVALDKAVEKGVVCVTSNGNSGPQMWTVGSPGTSEKAISVGASSPPLKMPYLTVFGEKKEISLQQMGGSVPWNFKRDVPVVDGKLGAKDDIENAAGKIVLIERGILPFSEKAKNAFEKGAIGVIIYNNTSGTFTGMLEGEKLNIPVVSISKEDGEWLLEKMKKSPRPLMIRTIYRKEEDLIAPFSSRGPVTHTWTVKPDVVAPGVAIDSTVPNGYLSLNGTSMSAPHVAGAVALIKQAHPDWTPEQIKASLMNTAKRLRDEEGNEYLPHEQGAGRIQLQEAINAKSLVYPASISFGKWSKNDRRNIKEVTVTVENVGDRKKTYYITPPVGEIDGIQWKVPFSFALEPGEKKTIRIAMEIFPPVLKEGIHHGNITVQTKEEKIDIPYLFFIEEPDYPRVMAFHFEEGDRPDTYRYEMYLPGGAEEVGIALYDPDTFEFIRYLDARKNVGRGLLEAEIKKEELEEGVYKALVFAKQDGREDTIETMIYVGGQVLNKENENG